MQALAQISEGATILLTWIINFVKWNAHTRYKFDLPVSPFGSPNPPPLAQKILNNALVPIQTGKVQGDLLATTEENEHILQGENYEAHLENIQKAQDNKKRNTYALKVNNPQQE